MPVAAHRFADHVFYWLMNYALQNSKSCILQKQQRPSGELIILGERPKLEFFIAPEGEAQLSKGEYYPTFTRPRPKRVLPQYVAGFSKSSAAAVDRWTADDYRYQPYQFEQCYMVREAGQLRALCASEREKSMGFGIGYTRYLEKAKPKTDCWTFEDRRSDAIGNSFHCIVVGHLVSHAFASKPAEVCDAAQLWKRYKEIERQESEWLATLENMDVENYEQERQD